MINYNDIAAMDEAGEHISTATLKAHRDALDVQIANYQLMERSAAIEMVRAFAAEHGLSQASLFPAQSTPIPDFDCDATVSRDHRPGSRYKRTQDE